MIKKIVLSVFLFSVVIFSCGFKRPDVYTIGAEKNAVTHNNLGLKALSDKDYAAAIQEFSLAILLNPKTQATSVYYTNLGEAYMKLGYFVEAQGCFEKALKQYNLNINYYHNLVNVYKARGVLKQKIKSYEITQQKISTDMIMLGMLYIADGNLRSGIIKLDEFCMREPELIITPAVRNYIREMSPQ